MLSILMKRKHQLQSTPQVSKQVDKPAVSVTARPAFHDKPWEETQAALKQDLSYLKTLSGSKEKDPFKEELIKKYRPLVEKLLDTHKGNYGNLDVMWWFYLWQIDLGQLEVIHDDFRTAIGAGLETPTSWKMNGQTAFLGYVFQYSNNAYKAKKVFKREYLINAVKDLLSGELATNAPLKVKMFRLVGDWYFDEGQKEQAHNLFELVMKLDSTKGGRKTKLNDLKQELGYEPH
ncbi:hypothetical protein A1QO_15435 [Vibrio genomosp. F10 str. ZF-129]|uniref:Terminase n=1 Tax=Vibrio genomosp. F10 str. ZF-129 TaxID=1187848 RepID=A0A1E5BA00_9VIBR|nr:phage terminase small subunit [Vibrio genomosp. F10]OEE30723.1 hypothetical protein A1QO_15435 [Vibrio genomosp. F10 str. ZF-129]